MVLPTTANVVKMLAIAQIVELRPNISRRNAVVIALAAVGR